MIQPDGNDLVQHFWIHQLPVVSVESPERNEHKLQARRSKYQYTNESASPI